MTDTLTLDQVVAKLSPRDRLALELAQATPIVERTLPPGLGTLPEEVGEVGPWFGLRFADGSVEGWLRSPGGIPVDLAIARLRALRTEDWLDAILSRVASPVRDALVDDVIAFETAATMAVSYIRTERYADALGVLRAALATAPEVP